MATVQDVQERLASINAPGTFATRRSSLADDLRLEVKGVGRVTWPITSSTARRLCAVARPARYGLKDKTRFDPHVRDCREIPKSRISIEGRTWGNTLRPMLDRIRRGAVFKSAQAASVLMPIGSEVAQARKEPQLPVGILRRAGQKHPNQMRTWSTDAGDVRNDPLIAAEVADWLHSQGVKETLNHDRIVGCPHEEGIDYPYRHRTFPCRHELHESHAERLPISCGVSRRVVLPESLWLQ